MYYVAVYNYDAQKNEHDFVSFESIQPTKREAIKAARAYMNGYVGVGGRQLWEPLKNHAIGRLYKTSWCMEDLDSIDVNRKYQLRVSHHIW